AAVRETAALVQSGRRPYAVVLNAAPLKREDKEAPVVTDTRFAIERYAIPVWSGQISERTGYAIAAGEADARALAAAEIARLWSMVEGSVEAVNAAKVGAGGQRQAA